MSFILIYFMQTCIKPGVFLLKEMTNADFLIKYLRIKLVNLLTWNGPAHPAASSSIIRAGADIPDVSLLP